LKYTCQLIGFDLLGWVECLADSAEIVAPEVNFNIELEVRNMERLIIPIIKAGMAALLGLCQSAEKASSTMS